MSLSNGALGHERPGAHLQAGGYVETPMSHAVSGKTQFAHSTANEFDSIVHRATTCCPASSDGTRSRATAAPSTWPTTLP